MTVRLMFTVIFILSSLTIRIHDCTTTEDGSNKYTDFFQQSREGAQDEYQHISGLSLATESNSDSDETSGVETTWYTYPTLITTPITEFPEPTTVTTTLAATTTKLPEPTSTTGTPTTTELPESSTVTPSTTQPPEPVVKQCAEIEAEDYTIPESEPGSWAIPNIICLYDDYTPVRIHCLNNGTWNFTERITCASVNITETTQSLHYLRLSHEISTTIIKETSGIVEHNLQQFKVIDIHYVAMILRQMSRDVNVTNSSSDSYLLLRTFGNIMTLERNLLSLSQELLNSTDMVLNILPILTIGRFNLFSVPQLYVAETYTSFKIYGVMIMSKQDRDFQTLRLESHNYEDTLKTFNFEVAFVVLPEHSTPKLYHINLISNDHLFNQKKIETLGSWIINIPEPSNSTVYIYFREFQTAFNQTCQHWRYGTENGISISGKWNFDSTATKFKDGYYKCEFNHTGYLGMIVSTYIPPVMCPEIKFQNHTIPETTAGSWAIPIDTICLHDDYTPVRIQCLSNGTWDCTENLSCSSANISETTENLYNILNSNPATALENVNSIIQHDKDGLKVVDIHYISQILNKASTDTNVTTNPLEFINTVNKTMDIPKDLLKSSQKLLNSTDTILYSLDLLLKNSGDVNFSVPNLLVLTITLSDNIYGAMITSQIRDNFDSFQVTYLHDNYEDTLINSNFETAFIVPPNLENLDRYYITIFVNDRLFNQESTSGVVKNWIVSILLPDGTNMFDSKLRIYFKEFEKTFDQRCKHWKYGIEDALAVAGHWNLDGPAMKFKDGYYVCEVNHTTHFGMLVSDSAPQSFVLDFITIFGSVLSIVGIVIIFLTALVFRQWRNKANSKIILNVSLCLLLVIVLFIVCDQIDKGPLCITFGMLLHYLVLAQFCWSLTISYSSYRNFHLVSSDHIEHVVMKFCAFSWLSPLIVIIITAAINVNTYDKESESSQICYPKGIYLKLGVCLPMAIILAINAGIYILITKNLLGTKLDIRKHQTKKSLSVQKSLILLFFMLGITWVFGFLVAFSDNILFLYLFCTTATCHGFVIFVFYILDSTEIMQLWKQKFRRIINKKSEPKSRDDQNNTTDANTTDSLSLS